jgi:predicted lipoprotein with Yx(FWY)xxD motif
MTSFGRPLFSMMITALALSGAAALADTGIKTGDSAMGPVLTDAKGMTLYTFDKDEGGASACYDKCAVNWPPLLAPAGAEADDDFGTIERTDGTMQWTYYGKPLYLWIKDSAPGDVTGDGVNDVWHVAKPTD